MKDECMYVYVYMRDESVCMCVCVYMCEGMRGCRDVCERMCESESKKCKWKEKEEATQKEIVMFLLELPNN